MEFDNLLKRACFSSIADYMYSGEEYLGRFSDKSYEERIKENSEEIDKLFEEFFSDSQELARFTERFNHLLYIYIQVYFEMGVLAGGKLALDIEKKYRQLLSL